MLSIHDEGPWPPCPTPFNLARHVLAASTARLPDKAALIILGAADGVWSYARLMAAVRGCGTGLLRLGLAPGDRVLMRLGNGVAFPVLYLGAMAAGLVPVPTSAALTGPEVTRMAGLVSPRLIVAGPGVALPDAPGVAVLEEAAVLEMAALPPCDWHMGDAARLGYVVFTSGTSGRAQAVGHAHRAVWARGMMHQGWEGLAEDDRLLHAGALNWTYTLGTGLMDPWTLGATALIPAPGLPVAALGEALRAQQATIFAAVPGVFRQMLRQGLPALPRLRHGLSAGEHLPVTLRAAWRAATGTDLHEALGMSECSTFLSGSPKRPAPEGALGFVQPGRRVAVLDEAGNPVARAEPGVLAVDRRDPGLMLGYLGDPAATAARMQGEWFITGDRVVMAADGAVSMLGRGDDLMNAGGFRVSPLEVEQAMAALPDLAEVAVCEVEVRPGVRVIGCAYVAAEAVAEARLQAHADGCLARWKQPRLWLRLDALPRSANNKLNRRALAALFAPTPAKAPKEGA